MKKKIKCFFIIFVLISIIIITFFVRKVMILSKLDKNVCDLENTKNNIYIKSYSTGNNSVITELFIKEEVEKSIIKTNDKDMIMIQFIYPTERKLYVDSNEKKVCSVQKETASKRTTDISSAPNTHTVIVNFAHTTNFIEKILLALNTKIKTTEINGKQCYELSGTHSPAFIYNENSKGISAYLEKETGLPVAIVEKIDKNGKEDIYTTSYEIEFDCVTDEDMAEPNISEYEIIEEN